MSEYVVSIIKKGDYWTGVCNESVRVVAENKSDAFMKAFIWLTNHSCEFREFIRKAFYANKSLNFRDFNCSIIKVADLPIVN